MSPDPIREAPQKPDRGVNQAAPVRFRQARASVAANLCDFSNGQWLAIPSARLS